MLIFNKECTRL